MELVQHIPKTELARNTRGVINQVLRGQTIVVEGHGVAEAAIIDIVDYRILRAAMRYHRLQPSVDPAAGLPDEALEGVADAQERYNLVLMHYLGGSISLGRAAELLELPALVLQMRFARLDIPVRHGPETLEEARADVAAAASVGGHG